MSEILDELEDELEDEEQSESKPGRADHLRPWQYKKGQSGNPNGRPPGSVSMKVYVRNRLLAMTEEEREAFLEGIDKKVLWEMAEGKPEAKVEHSGKIKTEVSSMTDEELRAITDGGQEGISKA